MTEAQPPEQLIQRDTVGDLKATVAARRELGPEMEDQVLEAFLARVEQRIDQRVAQQVAEIRPAKPAGEEGKDATGMVAASLGVAIPLVVVAAIFAHAAGVVAVMAAVVILNLLYAIERWR